MSGDPKNLSMNSANHINGTSTNNIQHISQRTYGDLTTTFLTPPTSKNNIDGAPTLLPKSGCHINLNHSVLPHKNQTSPGVEDISAFDGSINPPTHAIGLHLNNPLPTNEIPESGTTEASTSTSLLRQNITRPSSLEVHQETNVSIDLPNLSYPSPSDNNIQVDSTHPNPCHPHSNQPDTFNHTSLNGSTKVKSITECDATPTSPSKTSKSETKQVFRSRRKPSGPPPPPLTRSRRAATSEVTVHNSNCHIPTSLTKHLPSWLINHIEEVKDVEGDGHCGFRAIALAIGREEEDHMSIRQDLLQDLNKNPTIYTEAVLGWTPEEAHARLNTTLENVLHDRSLWLCMPFSGTHIAQCYQRPFIFYSLSLCSTFFPLCNPSNNLDPIVIAMIDDIHYVQLRLDWTTPHTPLPTIWKPWQRYHEESAASWRTRFPESQIDAYIKFRPHCKSDRSIKAKRLPFNVK